MSGVNGKLEKYLRLSPPLLYTCVAIARTVLHHTSSDTYVKILLTRKGQNVGSEKYDYIDLGKTNAMIEADLTYLR